MEKESGSLTLLRKEVRRQTEEACMKFGDSAAMCGASSCLADVPEVTDPIEQVKYLYDRVRSMEEHFMNIPWVWMTHCMEKGTITKMPIEEDWVTNLFIHRAKLEGGNELVLRFLSGSFNS